MGENEEEEGKNVANGNNENDIEMGDKCSYFDKGLKLCLAFFTLSPSVGIHAKFRIQMNVCVR